MLDMQDAAIEGTRAVQLIQFPLAGSLPKGYKRCKNAACNHIMGMATRVSPSLILKNPPRCSDQSSIR
jgi:hypothetical protein